MALKYNTTPTANLPNLSSQPLSVMQLGIFADDILAYINTYRPEYYLLSKLQRDSGCRINELFQRYRWEFPHPTQLRITPQKGNAVRLIPISDVGYNSPSEMAPVLADMERLPKGQYERIFAQATKNLGLWRLFDNGFLHPSSHFFRHLKVKELSAEGNDSGFIGTYIGEKNLANLDYYLNSQYFSEVR